MTGPTSTVTARATTPSSRRGFRPDIQALRAVAILAVLVNHVWPTRLGGGYIGVDVFFVISGYLITAHLMRELTASGTVRLGRFYARRVRRLLPAAFLVIGVSLIGVVTLLPFDRWTRNAGELLASAAYVENWLLAALSVNYSAGNEAASVAQHYWSLSVEEQFYLFWPLLLLAAVALLARTRLSPARRAMCIVLAIIVVSFGLSLWSTQATPPPGVFPDVHARLGVRRRRTGRSAGNPATYW